jgi:hypothetical protein
LGSVARTPAGSRYRHAPAAVRSCRRRLGTTFRGALCSTCGGRQVSPSGPDNSPAPALTNQHPSHRPQTDHYESRRALRTGRRGSWQTQAAGRASPRALVSAARARSRLASCRSARSSEGAACGTAGSRSVPLARMPGRLSSRPCVCVVRANLHLHNSTPAAAAISPLQTRKLIIRQLF